MGERLPIYGHITEKTQSQQRPSIINVESSFDPESAMQCLHCKTPTAQKRINYEFMLQDRLFRVRNMWARVCDNCFDVYVAPEVSTQIDEITFRRLHPIEARIAKLTEQVQSSASSTSNI